MQAAELEDVASSEVLQHSLTVQSIIITNSSFAARSQRVKVDGRVNTQKYQNIGAGLQGIVYERLGCTHVNKKELPQNSGRRLQAEFEIHRRVWEAFAKYSRFSNDVHVPKPYKFFSKNLISPELLSRMPKFDQYPSDIVTMERILPLPKVVRKAMIRKLYPGGCNDEHLVTQLLDNTANKHCLARIYLGKKTITLPKENFTLRNIPLTLEIMAELGLEMGHFAAMIGNAYAIMHWAARITGDDVEFVLGTSTISTTANSDFQHRAIHLYLLDFGQCETVDMEADPEEVFQSLKGSMVLQQNQLYLPHPVRSTHLYQAWKSAYLSTAHEIISNEGLSFDPEKFCQEYEEYLEDFDP
ncbi:hypothetical protein F5B22DRAFT_335952 [Xylaria bambusicola]|uniref:uncharacterized protein n=1 Tax=Xylaria bambusicola TaxID=326684 RepID=UPI0020079203|nr:uncharacterized protein F5B22DRAFT_335952 [Xylaria bambusicola]KAI0525369.1 hypothetical protein F5B22DRAFT_335952 [Xylaria bambusicola]